MKLKTLFAATLLMFSLSACDFSNANTKESEDNEIVAVYKLYKSSGGTMDYDDWLSSIKGANGQDGKDGTSLLTGNGAPASTLGKIGDSYIDLESWDLYVKENSSWTKKGNIKGQDGQNGIDGQPGQNGKDATSLMTGNGEPSVSWGNNGDSYIDLTTWNYYVKESNSWDLKGNIKGLDGNNGSNGKDGLTPYIGENGNWWVGNNDSGIPAQGAKGENGSNGQNGKDGITPHIGSNGNWWIGETDTGVKAEGTAGVTISSIYYNIDGELIIEYSNGQQSNLGSSFDYVNYDYEQSSGLIFETGIFYGKAGAILKEYNPEFNYDGGNKYIGGIIVPNSFLGLPVVGVASNFGKTNPFIHRIILPNTLVKIGESAFENCKYLETISIPDSVKEIGSKSFKGCSSLKTIEISENSKLKDLGRETFYGCTSLEEIYIPEKITSISGRNFYQCISLDSIVCSEKNNNFIVEDNILYRLIDPSDPEGLKELVYYPSTNTSKYFKSSKIVDDCAFNFNEHLEMLEFPSGSEAWAFGEPIVNCTSLKSLVLPNSMHFISLDSTIANCPNYESTFYNGTPDEWENLEVADGSINFYDIYFYSETATTNSWHYVNGIPTKWDYEPEVISIESYLDGLKDSENNHLYIHYYRQNAAEYNNWDAWVWEEYPMSGTGVKFDWVETSTYGGAYVDINLTETYDGGWNNSTKTFGGSNVSFASSVEIGFLIVDKSSRTGTYWNSDGGIETYINLSDYAIGINGGGTAYHVFLKSGSVKTPSTSTDVSTLRS